MEQEKEIMGWETKGEREKGTNDKQSMSQPYRVESPEHSPDKHKNNISVETGLSPLLVKMNLKRKHIEKIESDKDTVEERKTKKVRRNLGNANSKGESKSKERPTQRGPRMKTETKKKNVAQTKGGLS